MEQARRPDPAHAADCLRLSRRLRRDLRAAAAQRLRLGMADVPGDPAQPRNCRNGAEDPDPGVGALLALSAALAGRLFRQGVRHRLPRPAALASRRRRAARPIAFSLAAMFGSGGALPRSPACCPASCIDALAPVDADLVGGAHAGAEPRCPGCRSFRSRESRSSYNGLLVFVFIALSAVARGYRHPPSGLATRCAARRPGIAAFPIRARRRNTPPSSFAQPIRRVFGTVVFRARETRRHAAARRPAPGRASTSTLRDPVWDVLYAPVAGAVGFAADRLNHLQFLTIRRYLSWSSSRSGPACCWCWRYGADPRFRRAGRADAAGAGAGAAADRPRAQGEGAAVAPARPAALPALSRPAAADAQGGGARGQRIAGCSASRPI